MTPGMRTSSFPGSVEDAVLDLALSVAPGGGSACVRFRPAAGYGGRRYAVYVNGRRAAAVQAREDETAAVNVAVTPGADISVHLEDLGDWIDPGYDPVFTARYFEELSAAQLSFAWNGLPEIVQRGDANGQLANWSIAGLKRCSNCAALPNWPTRALLGVELSDAAGVRTVTLYAGNAPVAHGSRTGDGVLALSEQKGSGVSGSVTVAYTSGAAKGAVFLEARWPGSYQLHYATAALNFPRTPETVSDDDGRSNRFRFSSAPLAAGLYHTAIVPMSDTGIAASAPVAQDVSVAEPPAPPPNLVYQSGNAAATVIAWTASATPGATYNIYASALNEPVNLGAPAATHGAGTGTLTQVLPASTGYPGLRRVIVRAISGGFEDQNANILRIEYDASGNVVPARPNAPHIRAISVSAGRTISVKALYHDAEADAAPQDALLFLVPESSALDYASPAASAAWSAPVAGVREATLSAVAAADGFYKVALRARTGGGTQDTNTDWERAYLSDDPPPAAANVEALASRG